MQKGAIPKACKNTQKQAQLGEPVSKRGLAGPSGSGAVLKNPKPFQTCWARQHLKTDSPPKPVGRTNTKPKTPGPLGEPVLEKPEPVIKQKNKRKVNRLKGAIRVQKGATPKACKNTQKQAKKGECQRTHFQTKQKKQSKNKRKVTRLKGVIKRGRNPKIVQNLQNRAQLGEPVSSAGWANQSSQRGLAWATRAKPCKIYSSSVYIDIGPVRIAFCGAKPCETSYYSRPYIHVHPGAIAFCGAKPHGFGSTLPRSLLYVLYVLYGRQAAPLSPRFLLYVLCYMGLTRQAAEPPLSPSSILYVLYVLYSCTRFKIYYMCYTMHVWYMLEMLCVQYAGFYTI